MRGVRIDHDCDVPVVDPPEGMSRVESRWRCPECGQRFLVVDWHGSHEARRVRGARRSWQRKIWREAAS